jgi:hypothetical protein
MEAKPLESVSHGERIEGSVIQASLLWNAVVIPCVFAWLGCAVLRRRELAEGD